MGASLATAPFCSQANWGNFSVVTTGWRRVVTTLPLAAETAQWVAAGAVCWVRQPVAGLVSSDPVLKSPRLAAAGFQEIRPASAPSPWIGESRAMRSRASTGLRQPLEAPRMLRQEFPQRNSSVGRGWRGMCAECKGCPTCPHCGRPPSAGWPAWLGCQSWVSCSPQPTGRAVRSHSRGQACARCLPPHARECGSVLQGG